MSSCGCKHKSEILTLHNQAFQFLQQLFEPTHPQIAQYKNDFAGLPCERCPVTAQGASSGPAGPACHSCWKTRLDMFSEALEIRQMFLGSQHVLVATTLFHRSKHIVFHLHLIPSSDKQDLLKEAVKALQQAEAIRKVSSCITPW